MYQYEVNFVVENSWFELRFYVSKELLNLALSKPIEVAKILYRLKREIFLSVLDKHSVDEFIVLDEIPLREDKENFILLRINVTRDKAESIMKEIMGKLKSDPEYSKLFDFAKEPKIVVWSPEDDARNRILLAAKRLGLQLPPGKGWKAVYPARDRTSEESGSLSPNRTQVWFMQSIVIIPDILWVFLKAQMVEIPGLRPTTRTLKMCFIHTAGISAISE